MAQAPPAQQPPAQQPRAHSRPTQPQQPAAGVPSGRCRLNNVSIIEVINQLAKQLHINYHSDSTVKGGVYLNTYGETRNMDPRNLLEMILRISGFGMVQEGDIYPHPSAQRSRQAAHSHSAGAQLHAYSLMTIRSC